MSYFVTKLQAGTPEQTLAAPGPINPSVDAVLLGAPGDYTLPNGVAARPLSVTNISAGVATVAAKINGASKVASLAPFTGISLRWHMESTTWLTMMPVLPTLADPASAGSSTITSAALATDGVTLALLLAAPATITGSATVTVNGTARSVTWATPGVSSATKIGTLASPANQGDTVLISAPVGFLTPALAAALSNATVTNSSTVGAAATPTPAPTPTGGTGGTAGSAGANSIVSASLASDGLTLSVVLAAAATVNNGAYVLVNGVLDTITWSNPTTATTTQVGTIGTLAHQGDAVKLSALAGFVTPGLAAYASLPIANNSTVVPAAANAPVDLTPVKTVTFAGAAGSQPSGANAITFGGFQGTAGNSALDGSGNYQIAAGSGIATLSGMGTSPDGLTVITLATPAILSIAFKMTAADPSGNAYWFTTGAKVGPFIGKLKAGNFEAGVVSNDTPLVIAAKVWQLQNIANTFTIIADGKTLVSASDAEYTADGFVGLWSSPNGGNPILVSKIERYTSAQAKAIAASAALSAAQAQVGSPTSAGVYGEVTPADGLARGIYGPTTFSMPTGYNPGGVLASYAVRGMSGVTRQTVTQTGTIVYQGPAGQLIAGSDLTGAAAGTTKTVTLTYDNSLSGGTDTLSETVTFNIVDAASGFFYMGGNFLCDGQDGATGAVLMSGGGAFNTEGAGNDSSIALAGTDGGLFSLGYYGGISTQASAQPLSAHYGVRTIQATRSTQPSPSPAVQITIFGPQHPRAAVLSPRQVYNTDMPGDIGFTVAASSELGVFSYQLFGPVAQYYTLNTSGQGVLKAGVSLAGVSGQSLTGVAIATSHGASVAVPISVPVAAGQIVASSNMTAVIATNLLNYDPNPNTNRRRAVTPSLTGMPAGPVTWTLQQDNTNGDDNGSSGNPYALGHNRYVQNADGSVDALAQLSKQADALTLIARGANGSICQNTFYVTVNAPPQTTVYVGPGMAAAHGSNGFDTIAAAQAAAIAGTFVNPLFLVQGQDDPTHYDDDVVNDQHSMQGPGEWRGVASANGHMPRVGGFWGKGICGGINDKNNAGDAAKAFMLCGDGDWTFSGFEFSHIQSAGYEAGIVSPYNPPGSGAIAIRRDGDTRGNLTVTNCHFHHCGQGIEAGACTGNVTIINCTLASMNGTYQGSGAMHSIYIGCWHLTVTDCLFDGVFNGHLIKDRSVLSTILRNRLYDGNRWGASSQIDICDGGFAEVAYNVVHSFRKQNPYAMQFGEEMRTGPNRGNILNSHDNIFISNYPIVCASGAIQARTIVDPTTAQQGIVRSINDSFYGYDAPGRTQVTFSSYDYSPNYNYFTLPYDPSLPWVPRVTGAVTLASQPALDYTPAHSFVSFGADPGIAYFPFDGEGSTFWTNTEAVQIIPEARELTVSAAATGTVLGSGLPVATGCLYYQTNPTQPDPQLNPFADGNNTWTLRTDMKSYLGAIYPTAPAAMFTCNPQTGAITYHGGGTAGVTQYIGRECKNNTNGTVVWDYQYIRMAA